MTRCQGANSSLYLPNTSGRTVPCAEPGPGYGGIDSLLFDQLGRHRLLDLFEIQPFGLDLVLVQIHVGSVVVLDDLIDIEKIGADSVSGVNY